MKEAIVTVGISASGKSTHARKWLLVDVNGRVEISRDNFRKSLMEADGNEFTWAKWNWKREKEVTKLVAEAVKAAANTGKDIIVSDTNLSEKTRTEIISLLKSYGYNITIEEFPVTIEEAWKRDAARTNGVGHSVIAEQYEKWLKYKGRKMYVPKKHLPKCILVDIDGTLAHMNGKRGAFDWQNVGVDDPDRAVVDVVTAMGKLPGMNVVILSGRDGVCETGTRAWLANHVWFDALFMRAPNDMRKDTIVKEEIFWKHIADNYYVQFVIDDRPSVARMWRELGLKVFQVGNPHIEF